MFGFFSRNRDKAYDKLRHDLTEAFNERISGLSELEQKKQKTDRRRDSALQSIIDGQAKELELLSALRWGLPATTETVAFAEAFILWAASVEPTSEIGILSNKLTTLLSSFGIEAISTAGVPFDPEMHEACSVECDESKEDGIVLKIVRPGFICHSLVRQYATVVVNRLAQHDRME